MPIDTKENLSHDQQRDVWQTNIVPITSQVTKENTPRNIGIKKPIIEQNIPTS
ncbi:3286_t:CDS:2 [Dentiscutata heterogama]|uniref:3286_t:CDS:1 n=1 Tax=Dentiscutata heterogama TaxID=1316150 RepID=A0ACA9K2Y7_9GLOM|nr:3286_t:CDS:2 [Dentiscutata heterogama]